MKCEVLPCCSTLHSLNKIWRDLPHQSIIPLFLALRANLDQTNRFQQSINSQTFSIAHIKSLSFCFSRFTAVWSMKSRQFISMRATARSRRLRVLAQVDIRRRHRVSSTTWSTATITIMRTRQTTITSHRWHRLLASTTRPLVKLKSHHRITIHIIWHIHMQHSTHTIYIIILINSQINSSHHSHRRHPTRHLQLHLLPWTPTHHRHKQQLHRCSSVITTITSCTIPSIIRMTGIIIQPRRQAMRPWIIWITSVTIISFITVQPQLIEIWCT